MFELKLSCVAFGVLFVGKKDHEWYIVWFHRSDPILPCPVVDSEDGWQVAAGQWTRGRNGAKRMTKALLTLRRYGRWLTVMLVQYALFSKSKRST